MRRPGQGGAIFTVLAGLMLISGLIVYAIMMPIITGGIAAILPNVGTATGLFLRAIPIFAILGLFLAAGWRAGGY